MANGYRISESGDFRVAEDGSSRLTEGFNIVEITLSATSSVASVSGLTTGGSASLSTVGSTLNVGNAALVFEASLSASSEVTNAIPSVVSLIDSSLSATGTQSADAIRIRYGVSDLSATGSTAYAGEKTLFGSYVSGDVEFTRILENGDTRITEASDTRIGNNIFGNIGEGTVVALPSKTFFSSQPYYNDESTWKTFVPYVKHNGAWITNIKIYKHTNGAWKRSY